MRAPTATPPEQPARKRLHITPFNPTLLDRFVPPSLLASASGISFHTVQTFPDRGFGYVELPAMEAEKLKKKLNGSTLKGTKVRIEDAKPEKKKKRKAEGDDAEEDSKKAKKKVKKEKKKREEGVLRGHELEERRRIKRGWTEDGMEPKKKDKKSKKVKTGAKDDGIEGKKLRFKASLPLNAVPIGGQPKTKSQDKDKKEKKSKQGKQSAIVHEFTKSKKPSTAGMASSEKRAVEYEDGKGWIDDSGNVVETAVESKRPKRKTRSARPMQSEQAATSDSLAADAPAKEESEDGSSDEEEESSVVSDSDEEAEEATDEELLVQNGTKSVKVPLNDEAVAPPPPCDTAEDHTPEPEQTVHPLAALFKRPAPKPETASKPKPGPIDTSFSFFNPGSAAEEDEDMQDVAYPPQTPHTKEDLEWRSIRSAAPTPDTAAIGRKFSFPFAQGNDDDEEDEEDVDMEVGGEGMEAGSDLKTGAQSGEREESEFRKLFYDKRGDLNRGWKKRKREMRKAKRQIENRRLSRRAV